MHVLDAPHASGLRSRSEHSLPCPLLESIDGPSSSGTVQWQNAVLVCTRTRVSLRCACARRQHCMRHDAQFECSSPGTSSAAGLRAWQALQALQCRWLCQSNAAGSASIGFKKRPCVVGVPDAHQHLDPEPSTVKFVGEAEAAERAASRPVLRTNIQNTPNIVRHICTPSSPQRQRIRHQNSDLVGRCRAQKHSCLVLYRWRHCGSEPYATPAAHPWYSSHCGSL